MYSLEINEWNTETHVHMPPYSSMVAVFNNATTAVGEGRVYTAIVANKT
jgi:hypothetical protein